MNGSTPHAAPIQSEITELDTVTWTPVLVSSPAGVDCLDRSTGLTTVAYVAGSSSTKGAGRGCWRMNESESNITALLRASASGDRSDLDALMAAIYDDMRRLAESHLRTERQDHTLQPTALVHEAYLKLIDQRTTDWKDRAHFFAIAARIIRRILVDHSRQKKATKRGADLRRISLDHADEPRQETNLDLIALDEALEELSQIDLQQSRIVELRFFGGLTIEEIAEALSVGRRSVDRDWSAAKAWLHFRLSDLDESDSEWPDG